MTMVKGELLLCTPSSAATPASAPSLMASLLMRICMSIRKMGLHLGIEALAWNWDPHWKSTECCRGCCSLWPWLGLVWWLEMEFLRPRFRVRNPHTVPSIVLVCGFEIEMWSVLPVLCSFLCSIRTGARGVEASSPMWASLSSLFLFSLMLVVLYIV